MLLGYCISVGDIYRIVNGYDDCGNVCGRINNFEDSQSGCKVHSKHSKYNNFRRNFKFFQGFDYRQLKYLRVQSSGTAETDIGQINRICVKTCDGIAG